MNRYPLWKNLLILGVILVSLVLALPNFFPQDPSIEVSAARKAEMTAASADEIRAVTGECQGPLQAGRHPGRGQGPGAL
jgi:preprotein translocase subunit SecD